MTTLRKQDGTETVNMSETLEYMAQQLIPEDNNRETQIITETYED